MVQLEHPDKDQIHPVQWLTDLPQVIPLSSQQALTVFLPCLFVWLLIHPGSVSLKCFSRKHLVFVLVLKMFHLSSKKAPWELRKPFGCLGASTKALKTTLSVVAPYSCLLCHSVFLSLTRSGIIHVFSSFTDTDSQLFLQMWQQETERSYWNNSLTLGFVYKSNII